MDNTVPNQRPDLANVIPTQEDAPQRENKHKLFFLSVSIVVGCLVLGVLAYVLLPKNTVPFAAPLQTIRLPFDKKTPLASVVPTAIPFAELTIPYLRQKQFSSSLSALEQVNSNGSYTSSVTSYQSDGLQINGLLTQPTDPMPEGGWSAIVFVHGYIPPTQYQTQGVPYASYVDYLASNGFVVFKIDLRGHGNSEGEPGGGYYGADYVTDTLNAYAALQQAEFVNPQKIGMWGHSMAGNALMRSIAAKTDIPAVVIWAGAVYTYLDLRKYSISDASYQPQPSDTERQRKRRELFEKHGSPSAQSNFWQQVAPTNYLNDIKGAIEIHHAVDDAVVDIGYSRDLMQLLDKTDVPHALFEYPSGGHNISGVSYNLAMQRTVEFFEKYLE